MNTPLPKPTTPNQNKSQPQGSQGNAGGSPTQSPQSPAASSPPAAAKSPSQNVQLGGKSIPVPHQPAAPAAGNKAPASSAPTKAPALTKTPAPANTAASPNAPASPGAPGKSAPANPAGINPALAPKPAQPLQSTSPASSPGSQNAGGQPPASDQKPPASGGDQPAADKKTTDPKTGSQGKEVDPAQTPPTLKRATLKKPFFAQITEGIRENPRKWLLYIVGGLVGIGVLIFLVGRIFGGPSSAPTQSADNNGSAVAPEQKTVLTYWGLWEPSAVLEEVISDYESQNPAVSIDYRVQSHKDYRERLQTAIASGNGPDIFRYHAAWVPMLAGDLAVLPASVMSASEFQETFYPVAAFQLQTEGKIVGLPMMYDGLMLYYNTEILQTAGVEPPTTWSELKQLASELTVPANKTERKSSAIQRSGLAIGNATNVDHFADILALLIYQNGGDPSEPAFAEVRDALVFYTNFVKEDLIWDSTLPNSTIAFARGDAAMMFGPSWRAHQIMELNPELSFATTPLPQLSDETVSWANYWAEGVNERSSHKTESWNFLRYLTSAEVMKKLYSSQSQIRAFGEPYSRQDLAADLADSPYVGAVLQDASAAFGWYMSADTHDNGLNDNIIDYYAVAVNQVLANEDVDDVLLTLESGVKQELRQYGIN